MDLGFETIGNATLIAYDGGPVLATDPWLKGPAYFGSWTRSHEIPDEQWDAVTRCSHLWISHGHPDHLSPQTLEHLKDKTILLADHVGGRIARELGEQGYRVEILKCGEWRQLSPRLKVCAVADYGQDSVLLLDLGGRLIVDANDAPDKGIAGFLHETVRRFDESYLLYLTGYGDADLLNVFDEDGKRYPPAAAAKEPVGPVIAQLLEHFGIDHFVPFSSMHKYQRTDSAWANAYATPLAAHAEGFASEVGDMLPPFAHVDFARDEVRGLAPDPTPDTLHAPEEFGDSWSERLQDGDLERLRAYFDPVQHLKTFLGFLQFQVGGETHRLEIAPEHPRGLSFAVPRHSLMSCVEWRIFDDLLIGNYARCTLHGDWGGRTSTAALYPDFGPFLCKYADNGGARTPAELRAYFKEYERRGFFRLGGTPAGDADARAIAPYLE